MRAALISIVFLALLALSVSALADQVTPNDRVDTRLRVREAPNTESTILGFIHPGETAELKNDVPYWYEIRMDDGTVGFVSKGYARIIPTIGPVQVLRLGAWNIKKLGHGASKDFRLVADIIEKNFDMLVVVDVMQKGSSHPGYDSLVAELGPAWTGMVTSEPRPNTTAGHAEYYAAVYRTACIQPCAGWTELVYHEDNDGSGNDTRPDLFSWETAFGCFVAGNFDFILAPYHATWADGDIDDISAEVAHLTELFASMAVALPGR